MSGQARSRAARTPRRRLPDGQEPARPSGAHGLAEPPVSPFALRALRREQLRCPRVEALVEAASAEATVAGTAIEVALAFVAAVEALVAVRGTEITGVA